MSLYVGHLSPHARPEDLLRVFQKFGPCRIQLKDGYGFAVYEARADAERALRTLKGTFICGKPISLTWSNRQPRHFQNPARISRVYEPFHQRVSRQKTNGVGPRDSLDQNDRNASHAHASPKIPEEHQVNDVIGNEERRLSEDIVDIEGDKDANLQEVVNRNGTSNVSHLGTDRWGQSGTDHAIENGNDFDRYEPYRGYKDDGEKTNMDNSYGSGEKRGRSREKRWRNDSDYDTGRNFEMSKPHPTCYNCGQVGHIIRNCPEANVQREKFSKINHRIEDVRDRGRLKRPRYSLGGQPDVNANLVVSMRHKYDRKESHSGKIGRLSRSKGVPESKEENNSTLKGDSQSKKKTKVHHKSSKRWVRKGRARRSSTSSRSSESPTSNSDSHSKSPRNVSTSSSSRLRSGSLRSRSVSSSSRSVSKSSHSKSLSSRSRSKSRSPSRSSSKLFSLSVSLEPKSCSPKNNETEMCVISSPRNNVEKKSQESEDKKTSSACLNMEDEIPSISPELENKKNVEQSGHGGGSAQHSPFSIDYKEHTDRKESISLSDLCKDVSTAYVNHERNSKQIESPLSKSKRQVPTNPGKQGSTSITCQEIFSALRHYGLVTPEEGQEASGVEDYLGASRLWPWEIIYYRRLKKGPISIENYAKRLDQNKKFCIVDKYVRSSSGWGELN